MPITIRQSVGLNRVNDPHDVLIVKARLIELGFDWLTVDPVMGPITIKAIKLFQAIKNGFDRVSDPHNDGQIDVDGDTLKWLEAVNAPRWQKMPAGSEAEGFINDELVDASDNHDFGVSWLAETLRGAGATYKADFLSTHPQAALLHINDISVPQGGDTPVHATHEAGLCCDLRLPRKDGNVGGITVDSPEYDRTAMRAMLRALRKQKLTSRILLSDQQLVSQGLCIAATGHHNHAHLEIKPPARGIPIERGVV